MHAVYGGAKLRAAIERAPTRVGTLVEPHTLSCPPPVSVSGIALRAGAYTLPGAVGKQPLSANKSQPSFLAGTSTRDKAAHLYEGFGEGVRLPCALQSFGAFFAAVQVWTSWPRLRQRSLGVPGRAFCCCAVLVGAGW